MYHATYKCRLCGEEFSKSKTENKSAARICVGALTVKEGFYTKVGEVGARRLAWHDCRDGSFGFADFLGFKKVEE